MTQTNGCSVSTEPLHNVASVDVDLEEVFYFCTEMTLTLLSAGNRLGELQATVALLEAKLPHQPRQ